MAESSTARIEVSSSSNSVGSIGVTRGMNKGESATSSPHWPDVSGVEVFVESWARTSRMGCRGGGPEGVHCGSVDIETPPPGMNELVLPSVVAVYLLIRFFGGVL